MATIAVVTGKTQEFNEKSILHLWETLTTTNSDGAPVKLTGAYLCDVQVLGTFGIGGTVLIEGSLVESPGASDWATLNDVQGNALSFTAAKIEKVQEEVLWIRPRVSGGDGTTDLDVRLMQTRRA